jgi:hypothetical protein
MPTLADGSPLPDYITYDMETNMLTVTASSSLTPVILTLKLYAYLNDRVTTPRSEFNTLIVELYDASTDCTGELTWAGNPVSMLITARPTTTS